MRAWWGRLAPIAVAAITVGCDGGGSPSPIVKTRGDTRQAPSAEGVVAKPLPPRGAIASPLPPPAPQRPPEPGLALPPYQVRGRRDPFAVQAKSSVDVHGARLAGVVQGREVLALVESRDGLGYILRPGDAFGNARVTDIQPRSVTFAVVGPAGDGDSTLTLTLDRD